MSVEPSIDLRTLAMRAPLQTVWLPEFERRAVELSVWRLDTIDSAASGNKLFKLTENFRAARAAGINRIVSFGGAYSNHLHALALLGAAEGFETIGIVRGEAVNNPTLDDARRAGMALHFVDRGAYRRKHDADFIEALGKSFGPCYIVPEGAANAEGVAGCRVLGEVIRSAGWRPDWVVLPCATGSTMAGLIAGLAANNESFDSGEPFDRVDSEVLGIAVLKGGEFLRAAVADALQGRASDLRWSIDTEQHCGGYARASAELLGFIADFQHRSGIPVEPVYTGKMLYALYRRIVAGEFAAGTRILALHTGGLQGARGFTTEQQLTNSCG